ncbi:carbohydrate ABC transporter permease [Paenibacillus sacheonensis]|uniref:ABC transporter permease subunit n=1 Tax=Paenibacillus sacheonensis TaxID=742054 RepID=A0A7X4YLT0_9BACL|nr:sugar ABC transporter permease [Paenibacillus sacheonensis]MBM7565964.1 multiple sugar transport system permease protein [Paenibacillus sacheonensis]NBC68722.1 ABC transporter permease subunit [Paenibacillus sacheonensis]
MRITARLRKHLWGYLFLVPAAVIFVLFLWMPIIKGFVYSFYHIDFVKGNTFAGVDNYKTVLRDPDVRTAVKNTLYYMFLCLIMGFWVPIVFAIAISELKRFQGFVRVAAYLPNVIPVVVLYGLWRWLYDPVGPINATITSFGKDPISFMTDTNWSMISLVFMETWQQFGSAMLIYLAAVLSIPRDLYEAAEIDGAGVWKRIRHITLPFIRNIIVLLFVLQLIATSQGYQSQMAMLDGGPNQATLTYALLIVKYAFTRLDYGAASSLGVLMFLVLGGLAVLQHRLSSREVN